MSLEIEPERRDDGVMDGLVVDDLELVEEEMCLQGKVQPDLLRGVQGVGVGILVVQSDGHSSGWLDVELFQVAPGATMGVEVRTKRGRLGAGLDAPRTGLGVRLCVLNFSVDRDRGADGFQRVRLEEAIEGGHDGVPDGLVLEELDAVQVHVRPQREL